MYNKYIDYGAPRADGTTTHLKFSIDYDRTNTPNLYIKKVERKQEATYVSEIYMIYGDGGRMSIGLPVKRKTLGQLKKQIGLLEKKSDAELLDAWEKQNWQPLQTEMMSL